MFNQANTHFFTANNVNKNIEFLLANNEAVDRLLICVSILQILISSYQELLFIAWVNLILAVDVK